MNEQPKQYVCIAPRPNGGYCGFTTNDPQAFCPHDNVIVSTGEPYVKVEEKEYCPMCKQEVIKEEPAINAQKFMGTAEKNTIDELTELEEKQREERVANKNKKKRGRPKKQVEPVQNKPLQKQPETEEEISGVKPDMPQK